MIPSTARLRVALLILACTWAAPIAHPGENGYWLIEFSGDVVISRVLLPDHLLMHLSGLEGNGVATPDQPVDPEPRFSAVFEHGFRLEAQPALVPQDNARLQRQPGGFHEWVGTFRSPGKPGRLRAACSLQPDAGESITVLGRALGGSPATFVLDARTSAVELGPVPSRGLQGPDGSSPPWSRAVPVSWVFALAVLALLVLGMRLARNR